VVGEEFTNSAGEDLIARPAAKPKAEPKPKPPAEDLPNKPSF
jgi:hypothetical protein